MAWTGLYRSYYQQKEPGTQFYSIIIDFFYSNIFQSGRRIDKIILLGFYVGFLIVSFQGFWVIMALLIMVIHSRLGLWLVLNVFKLISIRRWEISFYSGSRTMMLSYNNKVSYHKCIIHKHTSVPYYDKPNNDLNHDVTVLVIELLAV